MFSLSPTWTLDVSVHQGLFGSDVSFSDSGP